MAQWGRLCEVSDVLMPISVLTNGTRYFDPEIKMEKAGSTKLYFKKHSRVYHPYTGPHQNGQ